MNSMPARLLLLRSRRVMLMGRRSVRSVRSAAVIQTGKKNNVDYSFHFTTICILICIVYYISLPPVRLLLARLRCERHGEWLSSSVGREVSLL